MVQAHLLELPVPLAARAQEHFQELLREFTLIATDTASDGEHAPARLLQLVDVITQQFGGMNTAAEDRLEDAIATAAPSSTTTCSRCRRRQVPPRRPWAR
jgi:hypothetical protein